MHVSNKLFFLLISIIIVLSISLITIAPGGTNQGHPIDELGLDSVNLFFDNGKVGIGTTNPGAQFGSKLEVTGDIAIGDNDVIARLTGTANGGAIEILSSSTTTTRHLKLGLIDNNGVFTPSISIPASGKVGIGTDDPAHELNVMGTIYGESNDGQAGVWGTASGSGVRGDGDSWGVTGFSDSGKGVYGFSDSGAGGYFKTVGSGYGLIVESGYVGIGITAPENRLQVRHTGEAPGLSGSKTGMMSLRAAHTTMALGVYPAGPYAGWIQMRHQSDSYTTAAYQLLLNPLGGNVGIGTTNPGNYKLHVAGTTYSSGSYAGSDLRLKKNIVALPNVLDKIKRIKGVTFDWKTDEFPERGLSENNQIGIIAQDIEKEFPQLVSTDSEGFRAVSYDRFVAVLLEAIKEQQKRIEALEATNPS